MRREHQDGSATLMSEITASHGPAASAPRVAVVDDDASFLRSVGRLLRLAGYPVETFASGREFLASLPAGAPQCLVLDVHMPEMTGLELYERLLAQGSCIPVVFVTAYETPQTLQYARQAGSILLLKPFNKQALLNAVNNTVSSWSPSPGPTSPSRSATRDSKTIS